MSTLPKYILGEMEKLDKTNYSGPEKKIKLMLDLADDEDETSFLSEIAIDVLLDDLIEFIYEIGKGQIKIDLKKAKKYSKFLKKIKCCKK